MMQTFATSERLPAARVGSTAGFITLHLRPNSASPIVGRLYPGHQVRLLRELPGWTLILSRPSSDPVWVQSKFLEN